MEHSVVFAGFGGQGILFAGQALARAAIADGLEVFWIPSYGPEMRGGTASCTVIISDHPIGSPVPDCFDAAVVMNQPALHKFAPRLATDGLLVRNTSLAGTESCGRDDLDECSLACTELAAKAGDDSLVSVVALGALVARTGWVSVQAAREALAAMAGHKHPELAAVDRRAFEAGFIAGSVTPSSDCTA
jgi:2-oxoglutarate ferredoxin oxidoreductase subunit gamma